MRSRTQECWVKASNAELLSRLLGVWALALAVSVAAAAFAS